MTCSDGAACISKKVINIMWCQNVLSFFLLKSFTEVQHSNSRRKKAKKSAKVQTQTGNTQLLSYLSEITKKAVKKVLKDLNIHSLIVSSDHDPKRLK